MPSVTFGWKLVCKLRSLEDFMEAVGLTVTLARS